MANIITGCRIPCRINASKNSTIDDFLSIVLFCFICILFLYARAVENQLGAKSFYAGFAFNFSAVSAVINASIISSKSPFKICSIL